MIARLCGTRAPMRHLLVLLLLVPSLVQAQPAKVREQGALVIDGIPEIPARLTERLNQYQNTRGAGFVAWHPSGKGMLIVTRFGEAPQLHFVEAPGMDRRQLTFEREPVATGAFDPSEPGGFFFKRDTGGGEFDQYYWWDVASGKAALLTDGQSRNGSLSLPDKGGRWAYTSTRRNKKDFDIYVQKRGEPVKLVKEVEGAWSVAGWSPDEKRLLLGRYVSVAESHLYVLDVATGETKEIDATPGKIVAHGLSAFAARGNAVYYTSDEDSDFRRLWHQDLGTGKKTLLTGAIPWNVEDLDVSRDGRLLAWVVNEGGRSALYLATTAAPTRAQKVTTPPGVIGDLRFDRQSRRLGLSLSSARDGVDAYSVDVATRKLTRWTFSELGGLDARTFVEPELVEYPSFDGKKIPAWYYQPYLAPNVRRRPAPVIIVAHGGPEAQSDAGFSSTLQLWQKELGAAVLLPNVRGSDGYGKAFLALDNAEKREDSVKDIGALLDWIATRPELDKTRVCIQGGSYGGYMVLASLVKYSDRLRCGVDVVGISNFVTFLESTEAYRRDLRRAEYGDERDPKLRALLISISPLTNADKIKVPLFVVQGKNDPRVPIGEAEQIVKTVRKSGKTVWYLMAKDEGHGFQKKTNRDFYAASMALFFETFLLPEK
jgi:dipeptidyl aminopeptidase/acylaminoacyl peptidase